MALVDDLLDDITDPELRARLREQITALRREKKFGLVFEHHLPELLCIHDARIYRRARVARRNGTIGQTYIVDELRGRSAICRPEGGGDPVQCELAELTIVKRFGEPVFPTVTPVNTITRGGSDVPHHVLIEADGIVRVNWLEPPGEVS